MAIFWPCISLRSKACGPLPWCLSHHESNLQVRIRICKTPEAREALALLRMHLLTNVNVACWCVCVYVNPAKGSEQVTCLPSVRLLNCKRSFLALACRFCFCFFGFVFTSVYSQTARFRRQVEGGEKKQHINVDFTRVVGYSLETYL